MTDADRADVEGALATVRDPELDQAITDLGFVTDLIIEGCTVKVRLRLPTFFCAPNFAYLMVSDTRAALLALSGVETAEVVLVDHFAADEVTAGVAAGADLGGAFPGLADGEDRQLDDLRLVFRRKTFLADQHRLIRSVGFSETLGDLPDGPDTTAHLARRAELGIDCDPGAPFLVDEEGRPVPADEVEGHLRRIRATAVSIEGNAGFCRGLLETRYHIRSKEEIR